MGFRRVGLLGSHVGNCNVCGHPYPPERLFRFEGKLVCIFHRRDRTREQIDANWQLANRLAKRFVIIEGMVPINPDGTPATLPDGTVIPPPGDDGGSNDGDGSGGDTDGDGDADTPPADGGGSGGDGGGDGGTTEPPVGTVTEADYIDGGCE